MKKRSLAKRALCLTLAASMVFTSIETSFLPKINFEVKAAPVDTSINLNEYVTMDYIKDPTVYKVLQVMVNYAKTQKDIVEDDNDETVFVPLPEDADLTSSEYEKYTKNGFTFNDLIGYISSSYSGKIDLTPYGSSITTISGLGYARGATEIDLTGLTQIAEIPADEFGKCASLQKITIPMNVNKISARAFQQCSSLAYLYQEGVTEEGTTEARIDLRGIDAIGANAFDGNYALDNVMFKEYDAANELDIDPEAFMACTSLTSIDIPIENADNLGAGAFSGCTSLATIVLRDNLNYIPGSVFAQTNASNINIPSKITRIEQAAFQGSFIYAPDFTKCKDLSLIATNAFAEAFLYTIYLPEDASLVTIEATAFQASGLCIIDIPDTVSSIGQLAFANSTLMQVELPTELVTMSKETFYNCEYLSDVAFSNPAKSKLTSIGSLAFSECYSLESTDFLRDLKNLTTIGESAFANCDIYVKNTKDMYEDDMLYDGLKEVILPDCVQEIGEGVFTSNDALQTVELGNGVKVIPNSAFSDSRKLAKVVLPSNLETIGESAFANCVSLSTVGYKKQDGTSVVENNKAQFPNTLTSIGTKAFYNCGNNETVKGLKMVSKYIPADQIYETMPQDGGSYDAYYVYVEKEQVAKVAYIDSSKLVDAEQALETDVRVALLGKRYYMNPDMLVKSADDNENTTEVYSYFELENPTESPYVIPKRQMYNEYEGNGITNFTTIEVDSSILHTEKQENDVEYYVLSANEGKTTTRDNSLVVSGLQNVVLPESLVDVTDEEGNIVSNALGESVFAGCEILESVTLPTSLKVIPKSAFSGCGIECYDWFTKETKHTETGNATRADVLYMGLKNINFHKDLALTTIGDNAFQNCYNLDLVKNSEGYGILPSKLQTIGKSAFYKCQSLSSVSFPSELTTIGESAFKYCSMPLNYKWTFADVSGNTTNPEYKDGPVAKTGLQKVDFTYAGSLETIGASAFEATSLVNVTLTKSKLEVLNASTFAACMFLETLYCSENITKVSDNVLAYDSAIKMVQVPASADVSKSVMSGGLPYRDATFSLTERTETISVPLGQEITLPINAFGTDNMSGSIKVSVMQEGESDYTYIYGHDTKTTTHDLVDVRVDVNSDNNYQIHIIGKGIEANAKIRVEGIMMHYIYEQKSSTDVNSYNLQASQELVYNIKTTAVPTDSLTLENSAITKNESDGSSVLYLSKEKASVEVKVTANPSTSTEDITYKCEGQTDGEDIVTIEELSEVNGVSTLKIVPNKLGTATITITSGSVKEVLYVNVTAPAKNNPTVSTGLSSENKIALDGKTKFEVTIPYDSSKYTEEEIALYGEKLVYSSSDESVLIVDQDGNVTAVGEGTATITVTAVASGKSVSKKITVEAGYVPSADSIQIEDGESKITLNAGDKYVLKYSIYPANSNTVITWTVKSGEEYVSVDAQTGQITALKKGSATIKATADNGKTDTISIEVLQPATSVNIINSTIELKVGNEYRLRDRTTSSSTYSEGYKMTPSNTTDTVTWKSSNPKVAKVDQDGYITAVSQGTAIITVTTLSGKKDTVTVKVSQPITSIKMKSEMTLNRGASASLGAVKVPAVSSERITFTTSDPKVATVTATGVVKAVGKGSCTITAKSVSESASARCSITVKLPATKVTLKTQTANAKKIFLAKGSSTSIAAVMSPIDSTDTLTYKSSKPNKVSVSSTGTITALKTGSAKITVTTTSGKKATIKVTVLKKEKAAKKVKKIKSAKKVKVGQTIKLTAVLKVKKSTDTLSWSVNDSSIASIDSYGYLTGKKKGKVKVTVTTSSGAKKTKKITVK